MRLEGVFALELCLLLAIGLRKEVCVETYGAGRHAIKALLALDCDICAIGSLELDFEVRCSWC